MKRHQYIRCPVCGKLSRGQNFGLRVHRLEMAIQEIGGRGRIRWHWLPLSVEIVRVLLDDVIPVVVQALQEYLQEVSHDKKIQVQVHEKIHPVIRDRQELASEDDRGIDGGADERIRPVIRERVQPIIR